MHFERPANDNESKNEIGDANKALAEINLIKQKVIASGAFDEEPRALDLLIIDVRNEKITPAEGVTKARQIEMARQSYH